MHLTKRERQNLALKAIARITSRPPLTAPVEQLEPIKGHFGGKCNRTACSERGEDVKWWNRPMHAYYCSHCKFLISQHDEYRRDPERAIFDPVAHVAHRQPGTASDIAAPGN